jgi:hypothetical protein
VAGGSVSERLGLGWVKAGASRSPGSQTRDPGQPAVAYFVYSFVMLAAWPSMKTEFKKYPNVYHFARMQRAEPGGVLMATVSGG